MSIHCCDREGNFIVCVCVHADDRNVDVYVTIVTISALHKQSHLTKNIMILRHKDQPDNVCFREITLFYKFWMTECYG